MRNFILRALEKLEKLDKEQIYSLIYDLADENERLEVALRSIPDGIMVCDIAHKTVFTNKAAERLLQIPHDDTPEEYAWDLIGDPELKEFIERSLENDEHVRDKEFTIDLRGIHKTILVNIIPQVNTGKIQGSLILVHDVTEKRKREARLRRAESLAGLTTLAAGVAHEIKNPLGSISIHLQLIQKALKRESEIDVPAVESHIEIIDEEINRLNGIVVDFLFAVRPMDTKLEEGNINTVLIDVLELVKVELEQAGVDCRPRYEKEMPDILIDEKYLKQAFLNLIKNAIAAMPGGGRLDVSTVRTDDTVKVEFKDTGEGISEEIIEKIFEPYFTTKDFGAGLGLTVVYKILKEHNGDITVQSKENQGTSFIISLPVPQKEQHLLGWEGDQDEI